MDTKTAIILGVWIFAAVTAFSKNVTSIGMLIAFLVAICFSIFLK